MGKNLLLWLMIAAVLLTVFNTFNAKPEPLTLSYSEFIEEVRSGRVREVTIDENFIIGSGQEGSAFRVIKPPVHDPKLLDDLYNHNVDFQIQFL